MARDLPDGFLTPWHKRRRLHLIHGVTGRITVSTEEGQWLVPPHRAMWIPGETIHQMRTLYVEPEARENLLRLCQMMMVTALLRDLTKEALAMPNNADEEDHSHDAGETQGPCHIGSPRG